MFSKSEGLRRYRNFGKCVSVQQSQGPKYVMSFNEHEVVAVVVNH